MMSSARWLRSLAMLAALAIGVLGFAEDADARLDGELSLGGFDAGTFISPVTASFFNASEMFGGMMPAYAAQPTSPGGTLVGLFSRPGLIGGFAAGFLGAGLFGLLFGQGVAGGLGGIASFLGLVFQLALVVMLARLIWTWWRRDRAAALLNFSPRQLADAYGSPRNEKLPDVDSPGTSEPVEGPHQGAVDNSAAPRR